MTTPTSDRSLLPITAVIPAYNAARFIGEALRSVQAQTASPAEVIVVDDGSTDRTGEIARAHGVWVLRQENLGLSAARNTAIRAASQPWIAFLDADDLWEPKKLELQWAAVEACPSVGAVFTDFTEFNSSGLIGGPFLCRTTHFYSQVERMEVAPGIVCCNPVSLRRHFLKGNFIAPSTFMVRRELLLNVGLFDTTLTHLEDRELWLRILKVTTVAVVETSLMRSRIHDSNWSSDDLKMVLGMIAIADRIFANPEKYPSGAVEEYRAQLPTLYLNAGRVAEDRGDLPRARSYYHRSWRLGGGARPLTLATLSHFPLAVRTFARAVARRIIVTKQEDGA